MMGPPEVHGVGVIYSKRPEVVRKSKYTTLWFVIAVKKSTRYYKPGGTKMMTYRCHLRCKLDSPLIDLIRKNTLVEFKGALIHSASKTKNGWENYYFLDLREDGTGVQFINLRGLEGLIEKPEEKEPEKQEETGEPLTEEKDPLDTLREDESPEQEAPW